MEWKFHHPKITLEHLGLIPAMLSEHNPKSAKEQLNDGYRHGGGWYLMPKFRLTENDLLVYPGDPPFKPLAETKLRNERIVYYDHDLVAIIQPDRSFEVSRMD